MWQVAVVVKKYYPTTCAMFQRVEESGHHMDALVPRRIVTRSQQSLHIILMFRTTLMSHCGNYVGIPAPVFRSVYRVPSCECLLSPWACHSTPRVCIHHQCMGTPSQHVSMYYIHTYMGLGQTFQHRWIQIRRRDTRRFQHPSRWRLVNLPRWQTWTCLPHLIYK